MLFRSPQFQFVAVWTQSFGQAVCAQNVTDALNQLFGQAERSSSCNISITGVPAGTPDNGSTTTTSPTGTSQPGATTTTLPAASGSVADLLNQASAKFAQADAALQANPPDLGQYQALVQQARALVQQAQQKAASP